MTTPNVVSAVKDDTECITFEKMNVPTTELQNGDLHGFADGYCIIESVKTKSTTNPKTILQSMKLEFPGNCITAIMGPSGSGKSTLLSVITDSVPTNITAIAKVHLPGQSSFIPQEDHLHGFYTCKKYMEHYARLAGALNPTNRNAINDRIDTILTQLGLSEQKDTIVGDLFFKGLSGGQKRRLSIALEVLTQPEDLFLDEPTSGLDSESALQVIEFLKTYAREAHGRRVILTIHQPSSFIWQKIDHVILLSKGKLIYNGSRPGMENFFSKAGFPTPIGWNCADHYVTMVNDEFRDHALSVDEWAEKFKSWSSDVRTSGDIGDDDVHKRMALQHLRTPSMILSKEKGELETLRSRSASVAIELTYRYFLNLFYNPGILGTRVAMYGMLAAMVGALFWDLGDRNDFESIQSRIAVLFYCVSFFVFMSVAVLPFTVMERDIVDKEVRNNYYHPKMYQVAQALSSIPGCALLTIVVTVLIIAMTGLSEPFWFFLIMFLSLVIAEALAIMMSHIVPHFVIGMAMIAGLYGFFMLYMGFMVIPSDFPDWLRWLYNVAFHTYAWRTFMGLEFRGKTFTGGVFATGEDVLTFYEIEDAMKINDAMVLVLYSVIIHIISFVILHVRYFVLKGKVEPLTAKK